MTDAPVAPLRQRTQQDMLMRGVGSHTRQDYIRHVRRFAAFVGRAPDTATTEDIRRFQLYQHEHGVGPATINVAASALRFLFEVTLKRRNLARALVITRYQRKLPDVLSVEQAAQLQGSAARAWLEAREADLLPVGYFHVVLTLPIEIADIAFPNKAQLCDLLFKAASQTMLTIVADPNTSAPASASPPCSTPGFGHDPSSAHPHDRARRRHRP